MKMKRINIGELIKAIVLEKGLSNSAFAKAIGIQRQNIEKTVFSKNSIDTDLLITISELLNYNFFKYYISDSDCNKYDYNQTEIKGTLSMEFGREKKEQIFRFVFGENNLEIKNK